MFRNATDSTFNQTIICVKDVGGMRNFKNTQQRNSSTSKMRVEFAGMRGGNPLSPYA